MTEPTILTCRLPEDFRARLTKCLAGEFDFTHTRTDVEAAENLEDRKPLALAIEPQAKPSDQDALRKAHKLYPDLPVILIAATSSSECYSFLQTYGAAGAIPPNPNLTKRQIEFFFHHMLDPVAEPGVGRHFPEGQKVVQRSIRNLNARTNVLEEIMRNFESCNFLDTFDLQLILEEILNNALLHAFRTNRNQPKYSSNTKTALEERDEITVEWAVHRNPRGKKADYGALSIGDNQGLLAPHMVWERFFRHTSLKGLLDTNGRGLYLVHLLSCCLAITIWPGIRTETTAFFSPGLVNEEKPISIRIVPTP